jgi:tRNA (guanine-N7-)-methyltransferase
MNPKKLKSPFTWETRQPATHDHILYVPEYYTKHQDYCFPGWDSPEIFGKKAPVAVEYCAGNGAWIVDRALKYPEYHWVAVEIQFKRVRKIWSKIHNFNLSNLFIVCGEGLTFSRYYVPDNSFDAIYVNFPDPWPKEKHAKKRLLQEPFLSELARTSKKDAIVTIVTDHVGYASQITKNMLSHPAWAPCFPEPHFVHEMDGYGTSYFDALWKEQGIPIHYIQYANRGMR